jgi:hypothetical protein
VDLRSLRTCCEASYRESRNQALRCYIAPLIRGQIRAAIANTSDLRRRASRREQLTEGNNRRGVLRKTCPIFAEWARGPNYFFRNGPPEFGS